MGISRNYVSSKLDIKKKVLSGLYSKERLSAYEIAKRLGCSHSTVLNYLKKYNIPRRSKLGNRNPVSIAKNILSDLYVRKKLTQKQIAEIFGHSRFGIQRWMKIYKIKSRNYSESNTKYPKVNFGGQRPEKAYLIGFRLGDLNVFEAKKQICARCSTTIKNQTLLIKDLFGRYGNVHIWKSKRGTYEINVLLNQTFRFLLPKKDHMPSWISRNSRFFLSFLAGYADAEGSYYLRKAYYKPFSRRWGVFEIQTYDKNIIMAIHKKLNRLGIECKFCRSRAAGYIDKRGIKNNKDSWRVSVNRKQSLWNFIKLIENYHRHKSKLNDLRKLKENLILRNGLPNYHSIIF